MVIDSARAWFIFKEPAAYLRKKTNMNEVDYHREHNTESLDLEEKSEVKLRQLQDVDRNQSK